MTIVTDSIDNLLKEAALLAENAAGGVLHGLYIPSTDAARAIAVHFEQGTSPERLIESTRPHEDSRTQEYRLEIHEHVTQSYAQKIVNLQRANLFNPDQFRIDPPSQSDPINDDDGIYEYLTTSVPGIGDIRDYASQSLLIQAQRDVNAWVVIMPETPYSERPENDQISFANPYPAFVPSSHVMDYGKNYLLAKSDNVTLIERTEYNDFLFFTDQWTILLQAKLVEKKKVTYEASVFDQHDRFFEEIARQVGGILASKETSVLTGRSDRLYVSPLQPTIPFFNTALQELSDLRSAIITHLHPQRYEAPVTCPTCHDKEPARSTCTTCDGRGIVRGGSALTAYTVEPNDDGQVLPPAGYIEMPTEIIDKAFEWYRYNIEEGFRAVNMEMLFDKKGNSAETARAKEIDREQLHNHFREVSQIVFPLLQWICDGINKVRYGLQLEEDVDANSVVVVAPRTFDTTMPNESIERLKMARDAGSHEGFIVELMRDVVRKTMGSDTDQGKKALLAIDLDPIPSYGYDEILGWQAMNAGYSDRDIQYKTRLTMMIDEATREDDQFLAKSFEDQKQAIDTIFEALDIVEPPSIEPGPDTPIVEEGDEVIE